MSRFKVGYIEDTAGVRAGVRVDMSFMTAADLVREYDERFLPPHPLRSKLTLALRKLIQPGNVVEVNPKLTEKEFAEMMRPGNIDAPYTSRLKMAWDEASEVWAKLNRLNREVEKRDDRDKGLRPCIFREFSGGTTTSRTGFFHGWERNGKTLTAICEDGKGNLHLIPAGQVSITFTDRGE